MLQRVLVNWSRLWDLTSELGLKAVSGLQMLSRALGHHGEGQCHATCEMLDLCKKSDSLMIEIGTKLMSCKMISALLWYCFGVK